MLKLPKKLVPWQIDLAAIGLIAIIVAAVYLVEIGPVWTRYRQRDLRAAHLAELGARQRDLEQTLKRTRDAAAGVRRFLAEQQLTLESRSRLNDRLTAICNLAGECGLAPDNIEPQRESSDRLCTTVGLRMSGRGNYQNCVKFLERLRREMPHNTVAGFELSGSPSTAQPTVSFNFQLLWHAAPGPATEKHARVSAPSETVASN